MGKLVAVHDRAASTWFVYDALRRTTRTFRKVSYIGAPQTTIAGRYVDHWYHQDFTYDAADRSIEQSTGVETAELKASDGTSTVKTRFTRRGTIKNVDSSYGELVKSIKRSADGLVQSMMLGDEASTQTAMGYDSRRRLDSVQTFRQEANLWSTAPPAVSVNPAPGATDVTRQLLLADLDYTYDVVGNPTEIRDWRTAEEWPAGSKPATRRMEYDDLYRVTRVDYEYPRGTDAWTSPHAADAPTVGDTRRGQPTGVRIFKNRPLWQTYKYDWLGNTTLTDDDQHALFDRSLGAVTHNGALADGRKPYQFKRADQAANAIGPAQNAQALSYDAAGNLTWLTSSRGSVTCTKQADCTNLQYFYQWDEVNRLVYASRPSNTGPFLKYLYDANDERVLKEYTELVSPGVVGPKLTTVYVFDSLELRRASFNTTTKQYPIDSTTEVAYLSANGMRLGRLHYEPPTKGEPKLSTDAEKHSKDLHILLNLPDHLGSSSLIIDHATGELVEARTYQPYGATESDYRPERWKGFREDYGFTGKEEDIEVGLQYFGKRYLSPYLGRWISADPLAVHVPGEADLNLYAYVSGSTLQNTDPLGLESCPANNQCNQGAGGNQSADADRDTPEEKARAVERQQAYEKAEAEAKKAEEAKDQAYGIGRKWGTKEAISSYHGYGPDFEADALKECGSLCDKYREDFDKGRRDGNAVGHATTDWMLRSAETTPQLAFRPPGSGGQAAARTQPAPAPRVNGNSKASEKPQHLYDINRTHKSTQIKETYKSGVSGEPLRQDGKSPRAEKQVRENNAKDPSYSYSSEVVAQRAGGRGARGDIYEAEKRRVEQHTRDNGRKPPGNKRP